MRWRCDKHPERELNERFTSGTQMCMTCVGLSFLAAAVLPHFVVKSETINAALDFLQENKERFQ